MQLRWVNKSRNKEPKFFLISENQKISYGCLMFNKGKKEWYFTSPLFVAFGGQFIIETETDEIWQAQTEIIVEVMKYLQELLEPFDKTEEEYRESRQLTTKRPRLDLQRPVFRDEEAAVVSD